jgi:hypothetical protein
LTDFLIGLPRAVSMIAMTLRSDSVDKRERFMYTISPGNASAGMVGIKIRRDESIGLIESSRNMSENLRLYQACTSVRRHTSLYGDCVHWGDSIFNYFFNTPTGDPIVYNPYTDAVSSASFEQHISDPNF